MSAAKSKLLSSSEVLASIRELSVHLHRGNRAKAEAIVTEVSIYLKEVIADPNSPDVHRAQQAMFAIDEVSTLTSQEDFEGAGAAARDAAKEWKSPGR